MSSEASPRPWHLEEYGGDAPVCIYGAKGGPVDVGYESADAALIVSAVNERDRLRYIVRRMMEKLAVLNAGYRLMLSEGPEDAEMADLCARTEALVRDARAAIGEGETPTGKGVGR